MNMTEPTERNIHCNNDKQEHSTIVSIRLVKEPPLLSEERINSPWAAARLMSSLMKDLDREMMCIVNLKTNHQPINMNIVSIGTLNATIAHLREVMKSAILSNAESMIMFHCHPSGSLEPSKEDILLTDRISKIGDLMDIRLLDHIIIGNGQDCFSFKLNDILPLSQLEFAQNVEELQFRRGERFKLDELERNSVADVTGSKAEVKEQGASYRGAEASGGYGLETNGRVPHSKQFEGGEAGVSVAAKEKANPIRFIEELEEDNTNMIDGVLNNMSLKEKKTDGGRTEIQTAEERGEERPQKSDKTERTAEESKPKSTEKENIEREATGKDKSSHGKEWSRKRT